MNDHYIPFCSPFGHKFFYAGEAAMNCSLFKCAVCGKVESRMHRDKV